MRWILLALPLAILAAPIGAEGPHALPGWLRPGARVTWFQGTATLPSAGEILVMDDQGNWVNQAGQKFSAQANPGTGGGGLFQVSILAADARVVAAETRTFVLTDPQNGRCTVAAVGALVGTSVALADYWIAPAQLAAKPDLVQGGLTVRRAKIPLRDRTYEALVTEVRSTTGYQRTSYDLATGLLLMASTSAVGAGALAPNPDGTSSPVAGATTITSTILADARTMRLPWIGDPRPEAITRGTRLAFRGTYTTTVAGASEVTQGLSTSLTFGEPGREWAPANFSAALSSLVGGPPQESTSDRAIGSASNLPVWILPARLAQLEAGTVVDEDPVTRFRTTFVGVRDGVALLTEEGPFDRTEAAFEVHTGALAAVTTTQQVGVGQTRVRLQRAAER